MALVRWTPRARNLSDEGSDRDDIERFFDEYFDGYPRTWQGRWVVPRHNSFTPRVDLIDNEKEIILRAEVPGVEKEDLDITITNDLVTLKGERTLEESSENECYYCKESTQGSFERTIRLPDDVVNGESTANLKNGILYLHLPKAKPKESIKIQVN